jgi:hypothetical protein
MARVLKFAILGIAAYAIATASPSQHVAMLQGLAALKDAITDACQREGSPCTSAITQLRSTLVGITDGGGKSEDNKRPWLDYPPPGSAHTSPKT